jgi:hypothetical protein
MCVVDCVCTIGTTPHQPHEYVPQASVAFLWLLWLLWLPPAGFRACAMPGERGEASMGGLHTTRPRSDATGGASTADNNAHDDTCRPSGQPRAHYLAASTVCHVCACESLHVLVATPWSAGDITVRPAHGP